MNNLRTITRRSDHAAERLNIKSLIPRLFDNLSAHTVKRILSRFNLAGRCFKKHLSQRRSELLYKVAVQVLVNRKNAGAAVMKDKLTCRMPAFRSKNIPDDNLKNPSAVYLFVCNCLLSQHIITAINPAHIYLFENLADSITASSSHLLLSSSSAWPLTLMKVTLGKSVRATSCFRRSLLATSAFALFFQPLLTHLSIQFCLKAFTTYALSL